MYKNHLFVIILINISILSFFLFFNCLENDRIKITISQDTQTKAYEIILENDLIYAVYKRHYLNTEDLLKRMNLKQPIKVTDRVREFKLKNGNIIISDNLDGRHTAGENKAQYLLTDARITYSGLEKKSVKLIFADSSRIEHLTIFNNLPIFKIEYDRGGHCLHYGYWNSEYEIFGAEEWQNINNWQIKYPTLKDTVTEHHSYYRNSWGNPGPLNYKGYIIAGTFNAERKIGIGVILPHKKIRFLKLQPNGGGFEIYIESEYVSYLFPVVEEKEKIISEGKKWANKIIAGEI